MNLEVKLNHLMIDVETMGITSDTTVLAIGAVLFNPETGAFGAQRHYLPPIDGQGGTISFDTIRWWMKTNPEKFAGMLNQDPKVGKAMDWEAISDDILALTKVHNVDTIWCNGIDFDLPILNAALDRTSTSNPLEGFKYYQRRDVRQWKLAAEHSGWESPTRPPELPKHDALADALWQCQVVCSLWAYLGKE
jgi:3' exoribonuclease, RNase T-like